ncbi:hypothetical protein QQY66_13120 [Streptomyces sp. DG2A-72]|uniref:hypothetical protein n=1 Tax=Streptomyces sp. DG2A-72 TaxID=3051386 RepID=UPI00265BAF9C|nr:hypothetical protein [Streptomyces sp. DG2A-72]MDO0932591.1 hypothetical protein [Streptomyces sp. DG2A-72]
MRKLPAALTVLGMAALGTVIPVSSAHAVESCADNYRNAASGYMYAYDYVDCVGPLGRDDANDSNWGDSSHQFRGSDTNKASSILNKGNHQEVQFFNGTGTGWTGGHTCLARSEHYASDLTNNYFTSGYSANNSISSHRWVGASTCDRWAT